mmetsp:Transcript_65340/g.188211  ORF Transcript_65340/g.188211 Transcript_65340/m.188211 type:complete len:220 (-) Transcript_65340:659-1318(-)
MGASSTPCSLPSPPSRPLSASTRRSRSRRSAWRPRAHSAASAALARATASATRPLASASARAFGTATSARSKAARASWRQARTAAATAFASPAASARATQAGARCPHRCRRAAPRRLCCRPCRRSRTIARSGFAPCLAGTMAHASLESVCANKVGRGRTAGTRSVPAVVAAMVFAASHRRMRRASAHATSGGLAQHALAWRCTSECQLAPWIARATACA